MATTGTRTAANTAAATKTVGRTTPATSTATAKKPVHHAADPSHYAQPELRRRLKAQILAGHNADGKPVIRGTTARDLPRNVAAERARA